MAAEKLFIINGKFYIDKSVQDALIEEGYSLWRIDNWGELLKKTETLKPDLFLLEVVASSPSELQFCHQLRTHKMTAPIPLIIVTATIKKDFVIKASRFGVKDIVIKPFDNSLLLRKIENVLEPVSEGKLRIKVTEEQGVSIIGISGEVDASNASQIESFIDSLIKKQKKKLLINLKKVPFIDSSGLGIMVICLKKIEKNNGQLKFTGAQSVVRKAFESTNLINFLEVYETKEEAMKSFGVSDEAISSETNKDPEGIEATQVAEQEEQEEQEDKEDKEDKEDNKKEVLEA